MSRRLLPFVVLSAIAALALAAVLLGSGKGSDSLPAHRQSPKLDRAAATKAWRHLTHLGLDGLRRADLGPWPFSHVVESADPMPYGARRQARFVLGEPYSLDLRFAQARQGSAPDHRAFWIVRGRGAICLFRSSGTASACTTLARAYREGITLYSYRLGKSRTSRPTSFSALGIVPDGTEQVHVAIGHRRVLVPVVDNAFFVEASKPITPSRQ